MIGLTAGITVGAFTDMVTQTIAATAELDKMAQRTGVTVEALSGLRSAAKIVGVDMASVEQGIGKLDKAMYEAASAGGKTAAAFKTLGVEFKDSNGNLRDAGQVTLEIAKSFADMEDSATKSALAMILFGRAGRELIPLLNELGEAGAYQVKVTAQQAAIAEDLEKNWRRLGSGGREMKQIFVNEIVPSLDAIVKAILDVINQTGGLLDIVRRLAADGTLNAWAQKAAFSLAELADETENEINRLKLLYQALLIGAEAFAIFAQAQNPVTLIKNWDQIKTQTKYVLDQLKDFKAELDKPPSTRFTDALAKAYINIANTEPRAGGKPPVPGEVGGKGVDAMKAFADMLNAEAALQKQADDAAITEAKQFEQEQIAIEKQALELRKIGQLDYLNAVQAAHELTNTKALQAAQNEIDLAEKQKATLLGILDSQTLSARQQQTNIEELAKVELRLAQARDNYAKMARAANIQAIQDDTARAVALRAIADQTQQLINSLDDLYTRFKQQDDERQFQLSLLGKTSDEIAVLNAARQAELEITQRQLDLQRQLRALEQQNVDVSATSTDTRVVEIRRQLELLPALRDLRVEAAVKPRIAEIEYQNSFIAGWTKAYNQYIESITSANIAQQAFNTLTQGFENLIVGALNHAQNAWKNFTNAVLQMLEQIAAKIAVSGILSLFGLGTGGGFNFNIGGGSAAVGGGNIVDTLLKIPTSISSGFSDVAAAFSAGYTGTAAVEAGSTIAGASGAIELAGAVGTEAVGGGIIAGLEAGLAAVPVAGWVALGALVIGGIISKSGLFKGGGPQTREFGTAGADISAFGDFATVHKLVGTDAVQTTAFNQAAATELATYNGVLKALGVSAPAAAFALYSSQDTKGTAQSSADIRATVGGNLVYSANLDQSLGRDPAALQARIQLEASRAVLAALQASVSSVPKFIGDLIKSVDVATATQEQIDNITKVAVALKQAADLIPQVSDALTNLDPKSIQGLVDAVGGVDEFSNAMKFLSDNFSLSADKADQAQQALKDGFAALNLQVPETHAAFLDLLKSFDLTTEAGRKAYASVLALSGAFVAVKGTADQAAEAARAQAEANRQAIGSLRDAQLGFAQSTATSPLAQAQLQLAHDQQETNDLIQQFIADKPWAQQFVTGGGNLAGLLVHIDPADFVQYSESDQKVILALINHAAAINKDSQSIVDASNNVASSFNDWQASLERAQEDAAALQNATQQGQQFANNFIQQAQQFAGQQPGADFGQKLTLEMQYIATQLAALRANPAQFGFQSRLSADYRAAISTLQSTDAR